MIVAGEISSSKSKTARNLDFLNTLKNGDTLVCSELSRLSRSTMELLGIVDDLLRRRVRIVFVQHNLDLRDLSDPLLLTGHPSSRQLPLPSLQ
jgi:DNA invertase Pin-like site-specific DNA recombinase